MKIFLQFFLVVLPIFLMLSTSAAAKETDDGNMRNKTGRYLLKTPEECNSYGYVIGTGSALLPGTDDPCDDVAGPRASRGHGRGQAAAKSDCEGRLRGTYENGRVLINGCTRHAGISRMWTISTLYYCKCPQNRLEEEASAPTYPHASEEESFQGH